MFAEDSIPDALIPILFSSSTKSPSPQPISRAFLKFTLVFFFKYARYDCAINFEVFFCTDNYKMLFIDVITGISSCGADILYRDPQFVHFVTFFTNVSRQLFSLQILHSIKFLGHLILFLLFICY